jgi:hypothetical protein
MSKIRLKTAYRNTVVSRDSIREAVLTVLSQSDKAAEKKPPRVAAARKSHAKKKAA